MSSFKKAEWMLLQDVIKRGRRVGDTPEPPDPPDPPIDPDPVDPNPPIIPAEPDMYYFPDYSLSSLQTAKTQTMTGSVWAIGSGLLRATAENRKMQTVTWSTHLSNIVRAYGYGSNIANVLFPAGKDMSMISGCLIPKGDRVTSAFYDFPPPNAKLYTADKEVQGFAVDFNTANIITGTLSNLSANQFVAPASGYFVVTLNTITANSSINVLVNNVHIGTVAYLSPSSTSQYCPSIFPLSEGDVVSVSSNIGWEVTSSIYEFWPLLTSVDSAYPNTTNPQLITGGTSFTTTEPGWLHVKVMSEIAAAGTFQVNGNARLVVLDNLQENAYLSFMIPVPVGDTFRVTGNGGMAFYKLGTPFKQPDPPDPPGPEPEPVDPNPPAPPSPQTVGTYKFPDYSIPTAHNAQTQLLITDKWAVGSGSLATVSPSRKKQVISWGTQSDNVLRAYGYGCEDTDNFPTGMDFSTCVGCFIPQGDSVTTADYNNLPAYTKLYSAVNIPTGFALDFTGITTNTMTNIAMYNFTALTDGYFTVNGEVSASQPSAYLHLAVNSTIVAELRATTPSSSTRKVPAMFPLNIGDVVSISGAYGFSLANSTYSFVPLTTAVDAAYPDIYEKVILTPGTPYTTTYPGYVHCTLRGASVTAVNFIANNKVIFSLSDTTTQKAFFSFMLPITSGVTFNINGNNTESELVYYALGIEYDKPAPPPLNPDPIDPSPPSPPTPQTVGPYLYPDYTTGVVQSSETQTVVAPYWSIQSGYLSAYGVGQKRQGSSWGTHSSNITRAAAYGAKDATTLNFPVGVDYSALSSFYLPQGDSITSAWYGADAPNYTKLYSATKAPNGFLLNFAGATNVSLKSLSGYTYTAPADGYIFVTFNSSLATVSVPVSVNNVVIGVAGVTGGAATDH